MKSSVKNTSLYQRIKLGELCDRIPSVNHNRLGTIQPDLTCDTKAKLQTINAAIANGDLAEATQIIEASYQQAKLVGTGVYEHNILSKPIIDHFACSKDGMEAAVLRAEHAGFWYQDSPENPYASALFALSVHQLGFEQPTTNWLPEADNEMPTIYDQCVEHMKQVMDDSELQHGDHWFWVWARFYLSISDFRGHKDLWARFDHALKAQPDCTEMWELMTIRLLPRWHGEEGELSKLGRRAWMHSRKQKDVDAYLTVFRTLNFYENGNHELILIDDVCEVLVTKFSKSDSDKLRTLAVCALAAQNRCDDAAKLMAKMKTIYAAHWLCEDDPRWIVGMSEIHRSANTLAA